MKVDFCASFNANTWFRLMTCDCYLLRIAPFVPGKKLLITSTVDSSAGAVLPRLGEISDTPSLWHYSCCQTAVWRSSTMLRRWRKCCDVSVLRNLHSSPHRQPWNSILSERMRNEVSSDWAANSRRPRFLGLKNIDVSGTPTDRPYC